MFHDFEWEVRLSAQHGEWLLELAEVYELVWATAWLDDANRKIGRSACRFGRSARGPSPA